MKRRRGGKQVKRKLVVSCALLVVALLHLFRRQPILPINGQQGASASKQLKVHNNFKYILYYTKYWGTPDFQFGIGHQPFLDYQCPQSNCVVTDDPNYRLDKTENDPNSYSNFDAVIFSANAVDLDLNDTLRASIQTWRRPSQQFVWFMMECPYFVIPNFQNHNNFFNLTMTYRWDSDIPRPYGWFQDKNKKNSGAQVCYRPPRGPEWKQRPSKNDQVHHPRLQKLANRPKKVAWLVSNCQTDSERELFVKRLQQYIEVDIFGACPGAMPCDEAYSLSTTADRNNCTQTIRKDYKFYLSFENTFCNDYVTEKFFGNIRDHVVIAGTQANLTELAPPHSHILVQDFQSAKGLAEYLHYLDQNDTVYLSYFWWQDYYDVVAPISSSSSNNNHEMMQNNFGHAMCRLCEKLHEPITAQRKVYHNLQDWWIRGGDCGRERFPDDNLDFQGGGGSPFRNRPYKGAMFRPLPSE